MISHNISKFEYKFYTMVTQLTIPEELFLLTVNNKTGRKAFLKSRKFDMLLAAAILMELALQQRIDSDLENIFPDQPELTGNPILDNAFELIKNESKHKKISHWLLKLAEKAGQYREMLVSGLVSKGLLKIEKGSVFLGFTSRQYPLLINDKEITEVKTRMRELIFSHDLPDFRDVVIVSIAWYGGLISLILTDEEITAKQQRIDQLARMDLIGQAVSRSLKELTLSIVVTMRAKEFLGLKTPEEKLEELVEEMKALMHLENDSDLPEWLRKGTTQYVKTLQFIRETGTNEISFNALSGKYGLKTWAGLR